MNLIHTWRIMVRKLLFLWTPEEEIFYIGGAEVLPPPLEKEEERICLEVLRLEEQQRQYIVKVQRDATQSGKPARLNLERHGNAAQPGAMERGEGALTPEGGVTPEDALAPEGGVTPEGGLTSKDGLTPEGARQKLISHNLRLVVYLAKKFENTGINVEDLISIGTIGLIKGINTFNPMKNIKLATYASRCIENEILMYLRRNNKTKLEVSIDEPLNVDWDGNELLLSDILGTEEDIIYRDMESEVELGLLRRALNILTDREREIIFLRYGLDRADGKEMTQKEVADRLGISQSYISRLEKKIMARLRKEIEKYE